MFFGEGTGEIDSIINGKLGDEGVSISVDHEEVNCSKYHSKKLCL